MGSDNPRLGPGGEFDLIARFLPHAPRLGRTDVEVGPGDDCAVVIGNKIALSVDISVEGVHFRRDWLDPHQIGCRAASAALSDLAAMAARPIGLLASIAVPEADAGEFAVHLMDGVRDAVERIGGIVLGGDLTRSPGPVVLDFAVVGECPSPVLRSGASPGDVLWVTGELGAAAVSIARLLRGEAPHPDAWDRFTCPMPRIPEALWLHERNVPTAMIDLSDGLAGDAGHLAAASGVAVVLDFDALPLHSAALADTAAREDALRYALAGGEDYELCFAAHPGVVGRYAEDFEREFGTSLTRIGRIEAPLRTLGEGVFRERGAGKWEPVDLLGFQHFGADG